MGPIFDEQRQNESLDEFLERVVRPTPEELERLRADVHQFVLFLQHELPHGPFTVAEVHKGGSLAKETAVRDLSDIDLVVYINGLDTIGRLKAKRPRIIQYLKQRVAEYPDWKGRVRLDESISPYSADHSYSVTYWLHNHKVDILPAVDVIKRFGSPQAVYDEMEAPHLRLENSKSRKRARNRKGNQYSASLTPLQAQFMSDVDPKVKDVIRLLKYWRKKFAPDFRKYCLELLAVHAYRQQGRWTSTEDLFKRVMELLRPKRQLKVAFNDNYNSHEYTRHIHPSQPYILDPANPYMNTLTGTALRQARKAAKKTLRKMG